MTRMSPSRSMFTFLFAPAMAALFLMTGGCVSQGQHDSLEVRNRRLNEQLVELQEAVIAKEAELAAIRAQLDAGPRTVQDPNLIDALAKAKLERDNLQAALSQAEKTILEIGRAHV